MSTDAAAILDLARSVHERAGVPAGTDDKAQVDKIIAQMKTDRLWSVGIPATFGGQGIGTGDLARMVYAVSRGNSSAGLIYAMHLSQLLSLVKHARDLPSLEELQRRIVREQWLVASGTSEKGVGGDIFGSICTVEAADDGRLTLVKESPNISYMDHAEVLLVSAMRPDAKGKKIQVLIAGTPDNMTLHSGPELPMMGLRGISNRPYRIELNFRDDAIFPQPYPVIARETMTPTVHIFWASFWSGVAAAVLDKTKACLAKEPPTDPSTLEVMSYELSRLADKHYTMNALIRDAITDYDHLGSAPAGAMGMALTARIKRLKTVCSEALCDICLSALGMVGVRGYAEKGPFSLASLVRDALSSPVMISNYRLVTANAKIERFIDDGL